VVVVVVVVLVAAGLLDAQEQSDTATMSRRKMKIRSFMIEWIS
jgi:hypothetical protein